MDYAEESWRRFLGGDDSGLAEIVNLYNKSMIYYINGLVKNISAAEDIVADTFLELIIHKPHFRSEASFKTYLFSCARNNAVDFLRRKTNKHVYLEEIGDSTDETAELETSVIKSENKRRIHIAISRLNYEYREIIYLLYFEDMTYEAAGKILHKNKKQITNITYRAKQALRAALEKEGLTYEDK